MSITNDNTDMIEVEAVTARRFDVYLEEIAPYINIKIHPSELLTVTNECDLNELFKNKRFSLHNILADIVKAKEWNISKGDVVWIADFDYRNDGRHFWDGSNIIPQDNEEDDYGGVPKVFTCPTFSPIHWNDVETHNFNVWLDARPFIEELRLEAKYDLLPQCGLENLHMFSTFTHNGKKNYLILSDESGEFEVKDLRNLMTMLLDQLQNNVQIVNHWRALENIIDNFQPSHDMERHIYLVDAESIGSTMLQHGIELDVDDDSMVVLGEQ